MVLNQKKQFFFFWKIFFFFGFRMIFFQKKDPRKEWFLAQKSVCWGLFSKENHLKIEGKKYFPKKKNYFFFGSKPFGNHFKANLRPFRGQLSLFEFIWGYLRPLEAIGDFFVVFHRFLNLKIFAQFFLTKSRKSKYSSLNVLGCKS